MDAETPAAAQEYLFAAGHQATELVATIVSFAGLIEAQRRSRRSDL